MNNILNIHTISGNVQEFNLDYDSTIKEIKIQIYNNHNGIIKALEIYDEYEIIMEYSLLYKGRILDNDSILRTHHIPNNSKLYFMKKTSPIDIKKSQTNSVFEEYIISPQSNSPCLQNQDIPFMNNECSEKQILLDIQSMIKDIHCKIMNSKHI